MNQYVTFQRVVELLEEFQTQSPILNSFGFGNLVDFSRTVSANTVNYPYMFVVPLSVNYDENITEYQFSIIFADLLNYDLSNEVGCVSDMSLQAKRFMSYLKRGIQTFPDLYNNMDIVLPTGAIPFMERFGDHTAGIALDCVLQVFEDLNACDFYDPTPSPSPTNTLTPTPTITQTPTMTMTPTPSPNSFSVSFVFSGDTFDNLCGNPQAIPTLFSPQPFYTAGQQLYYDSALTQFIDWNTYPMFLSTGGTQLYSYVFAASGLSTYGLVCPTPP